MHIKLVTTTYEDKKIVTLEKSEDFKRDQGVEMKVVNLYPQVEYQTFEGFGGAITEASGYTFAQMGENSRKKILDAYFGTEGNGYRFARMALDSCDFSMGNYSAVTDPEDVELKSFSLHRDEEYILPLLREAQKNAGEPIHIMLSPWSPPAFMKTNGEKNGGGELKPKYRKLWAEYICRYIKEYRSKGFLVEMITLQNEPNATQKWDSCRYTAQQEKEFLRDYLYPALLENGLKDINVCIWDHNKERVFERACEVIDDETDKMVQGVAFHWYTGDHFDTLRLVGEKFPDKKLIFSEGCVEYSRFGSGDQLAAAQMYAHDILGNLNAGMNVYLDWNLVLDEKGGPNHVGNYCDAPIMCDTKNDIVEEKLSHNYIGHFSRYIKPGAKRIATSSYTDKLEVTAFKNQDGCLAVVLLNRSKSEHPVSMRLEGETVEFTVPADSILTGLIE